MNTSFNGGGNYSELMVWEKNTFIMLGIKSMWGGATTHLTLFLFWQNISETRRCRRSNRPKNKHRCVDPLVGLFFFYRATASWKRGPIWELRIKSRLKSRDCCTQRWETGGELLLNSPWLSVWVLWVLKIGVKCIILWLFLFLPEVIWLRHEGKGVL